MIPKMIVLIAIVLLSCVSCSHNAESYNESIRKEAFAYALGQCERCSTAALAISKGASLQDPSDNVFRNVKAEWPHVNRVSRSYPLYSKDENGKRQWLIALQGMRSTDANTVEVDIDLSCGMVCAEEYTYVLKKSFLKWRVGEVRKTGVS